MRMRQEALTPARTSTTRPGCTAHPELVPSWRILENETRLKAGFTAAIPLAVAIRRNRSRNRSAGEGSMGIVYRAERASN